MRSLAMEQEYKLPQARNNNGVRISIYTSRMEDA
jgi:hypothetical protein